MALPPKWATLETQINALIASLMNQVGDKAEAFLAQHGWYFQGIATGQLPADGALVTPDPTGRPHYQLENWSTYGVNFPPKIPCTVAVWNYSGPKGKDWALRIGVTLDGVTYLKVNSAHELEVQTTDWLVQAPPLVLPPGVQQHRRHKR